jgi:hypothetical protein
MLLTAGNYICFVSIPMAHSMPEEVDATKGANYCFFVEYEIIFTFLISIQGLAK